ncbi:MAG: methylated-DNA--[protein]-cysteine S-methyltransferase, partial [Shewanella sp.]
NVWRALLNLPKGEVASYGDIAKAIGKPKASRAVGTAIGANPVALLIPCHRVLRQSGELGGYRWGETRKHAILAREAAYCE